MKKAVKKQCDLCGAHDPSIKLEALELVQRRKKQSFLICADCMARIIGSASTDAEKLARIYSVLRG